MRYAPSRREIKKPSKRPPKPSGRIRKLDSEAAISELGVGEALVSFLDEKGRPSIVDRALIYPPQSQLPPLTPAERDSIVKQSSLFGHYEKVVDRESAYEMLKARAPQAEETTAPAGKSWQSEVAGTLSALGKGAARAMGTQVGREIVRGVLGSLFGATTTRRRR